ncbi:MAG: hypothetical protein C4537_04850 [Acholeplasma sp.]|jgi:hypothetical protein|nr:MAG: hypothetical protein C4537_04850 [Acholeplasma sp.]
MNIFKHKKGSALPTVIAITTLLLGAAATLMVTAVEQARLVEKNIEKTEEYNNAIYRVDASMQIIMRELSNDPDYLKNASNVTAIETYLGVTITPSDSYTLYSVTQAYTDTQIINSYLSTTGEVTLPEEEQDNLENFIPVVDPEQADEVALDTATSLIEIYTETHSIDSIENVDNNKTISDLVVDVWNSDSFTTISSSNTFRNGGTIDDHYVFTGNFTLNAGKTLVIEEGYILFIKGSIIVREGAKLYGNVVVSGGATFRYKKNTSTTFEGTLYADEKINIDNPLQLGTSTRPTFMFSEKDITADYSLNGYGYFICDDFSAENGSITGGIIANDISLDGLKIESFNLMTIYDKFFDYALPLSLQGGSDGNFVYTNPKIG